MASPARRPTDLPIEGVVDQIGGTTDDVVLVAEPGAGKSSVVPLAVAASVAGRVLVLEPRRLAARATAERLAASLDPPEPLGSTIGLSMRGERRVEAATRIEVITEALLTARLQRDPELAGVDAIVFDEFHERNLHSDLGLAMALEIRQTVRPDLRLVVMSATLDAAGVANLLEAGTGARPLELEAEGRVFPIDTVHLGRPPIGDHRAWVRSMAVAIGRALAETSNAVLAFVPGRSEIDRVIRELSSSGTVPVDVPIIGLHGTSARPDRRRALDPAGGRRVVVATAVAETSVTLAGVTAVVDGGLARRARFDPVTGLGRLETGTVSLSSADQRRGRAGRVGPGVCYRLWSADDERHFDPTEGPEVLVGDPLPLAFELVRWGDPDAEHLLLLDKPDQSRLAAARDRLTDLGHIDNPPTGPRLSEQGRRAADLGVHPRDGRLLLAARGIEEAQRAAHVVATLEADGSVDLERGIENAHGPIGDRAAQLLGRLRRGQEGGNPEQRHGDGGPGAARTIRSLGAQLASAWPDRVAMARPERPGIFAVAAGGEVDASGTALATADMIVVGHASGGGRGGPGGALRLRSGVPVSPDEVFDELAAQIHTEDVVEWNTADDSLRAERRRNLGTLVLSRGPLADPPADALTRALLDALADGLDRLDWGENGHRLRQRLAWLHRQDPDRWPNLDDDALLARADEWLDLSRCRRPADLARIDAVSGLWTLVGWNRRSEVDELAPDELPTPTGRGARVDYAGDEPVWPVQLQRLLGLNVHPLIGPRHQPVVIELLSPARRPVQRTTDLPGFWRGSYADVRRELRGRYPKHAWPERPWEHH